MIVFKNHSLLKPWVNTLCCSTKVMAEALLFVSLMILSSCTWINTFSTPKPKAIESLLAQRHYNEVLEITGRQLSRSLSAEQASYWQSIDDKATTEAAAFQQEQTQRLNRLARRNDWAKANVEQQFLQRHLPPNPQLSDLFIAVDRQRKQYIDGLTRSLAKLEIKYLPQTLKLYERLFEASPDDASALDHLQQERLKRDRIVLVVKDYAAKAEAQQQYGLALDYMRSIQRLDDSAVILNQIKRLRTLLAEQQKQRVALSNSSQLSKKQQQQLLDYDEALAQQQWFEAKAILAAMLKQRPGDKSLIEEQQRLADQLDSEVERATAQGEVYYSEGNIEAALIAWQAVLPLAPNDAQLLANIERAQRILDKVKTLKQGDPNENR